MAGQLGSKMAGTLVTWKAGLSVGVWALQTELMKAVLTAVMLDHMMVAWTATTTAVPKGGR
jgi:hypothetical protein